MSSSVDPITISVIRYRMLAIARDMGNTVMRTARSVILNECHDFSIGIFDSMGQILSQVEGIPVHACALPFAMKAVINAYGDNVSEGDARLVNDPYTDGAGAHLPDWVLFLPVFYEKKLAFWTCVKAHQVDCAGGVPGSLNPKAIDIHAEGLRIPPIKICEAGKPKEDIWRFILKNLRLPQDQEGDLLAMWGCLRLGERRILSLIEKYGIDQVNASVNAVIEATEKAMRKRIAEIPDGRYEAEEAADNDGWTEERVYVRCTITVKGDEMAIDFTGSDPQVHYINSPIANTYSATMSALFSSITPDIDHNVGAYRPVKIIAPEGTCVNPSYPATVSCCTIFLFSQIETCVWKALAKAIPEQVSAGWARYYGPVVAGMDHRTQEPYIEIPFYASGGSGAIWGYDGWPHLAPDNTCGGLWKAPIETYEVKRPWLIKKYELLEGSAGAGKYRGGLGVIFEFENLGPEAQLYMLGEGEYVTPFGLLGGKSSPPNEAYLILKNDEKKTIHSKDIASMPTGAIWRVRASGGGGVGDPFQRDIEKVKDDVLNGYISLESAKEDYGVVFDLETLEVNYIETEKLRSKRSH